MYTTRPNQFAFLATILTLSVACSPRVPVSVEGAGIQSNRAALQDPPANTGVKNYEQIFMTYQGLTGLVVEDTVAEPFVPPTLTGNCIGQTPNSNPFRLAPSNNATKAEVMNMVWCTYQRERSSLPLSNKLSSFSGSAQSAIQKLASAFCSAVFQNSKLRSDLMGESLFPRQAQLPVPSALFSDASKKDEFVSTIINRFWTPGQTNPDSGEARTQLTRILDNMLAVAQPNQEQATLAISMGVCTAALASAPVTMR
jgi:hypothetical protein